MKKELVSISQRSNFEAKLPLDFSRLPKQETTLAKLLSNLRFASAKVCIKKSPNNYCRGSELLLELSELISELSELGLYIFLLHYMFFIHSIFLFR